MPDISFYVLPTESVTERLLFACKLLEKAYRSGHFCYVLTASPAQSQALDDLLWTFRPGSFVPHQLFTGQLPEVEQCILIGMLDAPPPWHNTLLNLSPDYPSDFLQFSRILEVLDNSEATKSAGRQHYTLYKKAGFEPTTHKIKASDVANSVES